jgi:hypothetical protein
MIKTNKTLLESCDFLIEETAKSRMISKAKSKFRSTGQIMTPRERADSKPDVIDKSKRRLLKGAAIGTAAAVAVPILKHVSSGVKKIEAIDNSMHSAGKTLARGQSVSDAKKLVNKQSKVENPERRDLLATTLTSSDGYKTLHNVGKAGKLAAKTGLTIGSVFASDEVYDEKLKLVHT